MDKGEKKGAFRWDDKSCRFVGTAELQFRNQSFVDINTSDDYVRARSTVTILQSHSAIVPSTSEIEAGTER